MQQYVRGIPSVRKIENKQAYLLQNGKFFLPLHSQINMVPIVQLVRMSDCGSEGRGFEPHLAPFKVLKIFFGTLQGPEDFLQDFFVVNRKGIQISIVQDRRDGNVGSPGKPWITGETLAQKSLKGGLPK